MSKSPSNPKAVLEGAAIRYLSFRPRFSVEVESHLLQKAIELGLTDPVALIDQIIESLKLSKFLDDNSLLERYIHSRLVEKVRGPYWIKSRLFHLGLKKDVVEIALKRFAPRDLQIEVLKNYLSRKNPANPKEKARLIRRLSGRGFNHEIIGSGFDWEDQAE